MMAQDASTWKSSAWRAAVMGGALLALLMNATWAPAAQPSSANRPQKVAKAAATVVAAASPQITIENFKFNPATLTVPVGTTVTWTNHDGEPHTVTSSTKLFSSKGLEQGERFSYTFSTPDTYIYYCALHPHMTGTIVVK